MNSSSRIADLAPLVAVLAAGAAARFGGGKLDASLAGQRVGAWCLAAVAEAGLPAGIIVTPEAPPAFAQESEGWTIIRNPQATRGQGTSLALAAREAQARGAPALLVLLADMPLVGAKHLTRLAASYAPAATRLGQAVSPPALIAPSLYPALAQLDGDRGAGPLLSARSDLSLLDAPAAMLLDIDRRDDLARAEALLNARQP